MVGTYILGSGGFPLTKLIIKQQVRMVAMMFWPYLRFINVQQSAVCWAVRADFNAPCFSRKDTSSASVIVGGSSLQRKELENFARGTSSDPPFSENGRALIYRKVMNHPAEKSLLDIPFIGSATHFTVPQCSTVSIHGEIVAS